MGTFPPLYCSNCGAANQPQAAFCFACGLPLQAPMVDPTVATSSSPGSAVSRHLLKERYRLVGQSGTGGMGAVYKAEDTLFADQLVAVKELSQNGLKPEEKVEATDTFKGEAHLLAGLSHPNLPKIHDYFSDAGHWYLVMDFIAGETLETYLNRAPGGHLPVQEALEIGMQLCTVLDYLHMRQPPIIFRDLKPSNVMRTPDGRLYLIDFGIARHFKPGQARDTAPFGSAGYAAPEQYGKAQTTPRSDIYSLGALLHQLLSGDDPAQTPFQFAPLKLHGQTAPAGLETLIMQMLEMNAGKRPASMAEVKQELQRLAAEQTAIEMEALQARVSSPPSPPKAAKPPRPVPPKPYVLPSQPAGTVHTVLIGHTGPVTALAWSPSGMYIASASNDATVKVWEWASANNMYTYRGHSYAVTALAWSPDGEYIASGDFLGKLQVWYAVDGKHVYTYRGPYTVTAVTWSPDSRRISFADDHGRVQVQDAVDGGHAYTYSGHSGAVHAVAWSPDGTRIASGGDDSTVQVWDATRGDKIFTCRGNANWSVWINAVSWSPDGKSVASGGANGMVQIWNAVAGNKLVTCHDHSGAVLAVAWSPDGRSIASGSADCTVRMCDAVIGSNNFIYRSHTNHVNAVAWSPDGRRIVSGSDDKTVQVWQAM